MIINGKKRIQTWKRYVSIMLVSLVIMTFINSNQALAENQLSINVRGKVVELNGQALYTGEDALIEDGTTLVPLRPIFEALGLELNWNADTSSIVGKKGNKKIELQVDSNEAKVDGKSVTLEVPPKIINGKTMVPLRLIGESLGANVNYYSYDYVKKRLLSTEEQQLYDEYNDTLYLYNESVISLKNANQEYNDTESSYPVFAITGEIKSRNPFYIWGTSFSSEASRSHPGQIMGNSNIIIENPDDSKIYFGAYAIGEHYYKGSTTTKGLLGQDVPVYIFGGPPEELRSLLDSIKQKIKAAEQKVESKRNNLEAAGDEIIRLYQKQVDSNSDELNRAQLFVSLVSSAADIDTDLIKKSMGFVNSYPKYQNNQAKMYGLAYADEAIQKLTPDWNKRIESFKDIAEIDPYFLLNYATSGYDFYDVGVALSQIEGHEDKAKYAFFKAIEMGNLEVQKNANNRLATLKQSKPVNIDNPKKEDSNSTTSNTSPKVDSNTMLVLPNQKITVDYRDWDGKVYSTSLEKDVISVDGHIMVGFKTLEQLNYKAKKMIFLDSYLQNIGYLLIDPGYEAKKIELFMKEAKYGLMDVNYKDIQKGKLEVVPVEYDGEVYVPIETFALMGLSATAGDGYVEINVVPSNEQAVKDQRNSTTNQVSANTYYVNSVVDNIVTLAQGNTTYKVDFGDGNLSDTLKQYVSLTLTALKENYIGKNIVLPLNHIAQKLTELPVQGLTNIMTVSQ